MKLLWVSNAPFVGSGYGVQTDLFARAAAADGHDVTVFGWFGHHGPPMRLSGVTVLPASGDAWGNDILSAHVDHLQPDVTVILGDAWVFNPAELARTGAVFWAPIDHQSVPPLVAKNLRACRSVWSMSLHGHASMLAEGLKPVYVPHGVDTQVYRPVERRAARRRWNVPDSAFFAMSVAANRGWPSRKSLDRLLKAWALFVRRHPEAVLYLHTQPQSADGIDLERVAAFYGVPRKNLRFPDMYRLARNEYSAEIMNDLYNAADVFVLPSAGEGFGVPAIEAQAAGCPVILSDATAQTELCGSGWRVTVDAVDDYAITPQYAEQVNVRPTAILRALAAAQATSPVKLAAYRDAARAFALDYDYRRIWRDIMRPALEIEAKRSAEYGDSGGDGGAGDGAADAGGGRRDGLHAGRDGLLAR